MGKKRSETEEEPRKTWPPKRNREPERTVKGLMPVLYYPFDRREDENFDPET